MGDYVVNASSDLIKAIRSGQLSEVIAVLNANSAIELNDSKGNPGLAFVMACLMGHSEIVRELLIRGASVNSSNNNSSTSPLATAVRAKKTEVIKVLIEHGVEIPEGMETGLRKDELILAHWKAQHFGASRAPGGFDESAIEVIQVLGGCYGTSTDVLDAEMKRAIKDFPQK